MNDKVYPLALTDAARTGYRIMAQLTGECRPPQKGEWYLSGAIPEAYQAPASLYQPFKIVKLVAVNMTTGKVRNLK
jgi:hypothetical protein